MRFWCQVVNRNTVTRPLTTWICLSSTGTFNHRSQHNIATSFSMVSSFVQLKSILWKNWLLKKAHFSGKIS